MTRSFAIGRPTSIGLMLALLIMSPWPAATDAAQPFPPLAVAAGHCHSPQTRHLLKTRRRPRHGQMGADLRCVGLRTRIARKTEGAAAGQLIWPVPKGPPTNTEVPPFEPPLREILKLELKKAEDHAAVQGSSDSVVLAVTSPSGIGELTIRPVAASWPKTIVLRLNLRGLEQLSIVSDEARVTLVGAVQSHGDRRQHLQLSRGETTSAVERGDPYFTEIEAFDNHGRAADAIPLEQGYFQLEIPAAMLKEDAKKLSIRWIDFYRS